MSEKEELCKLLLSLEPIIIKRIVRASTRAPEEFLNEIQSLESILDLRQKVCTQT